ncbi:MAG TPA: glycosyltransferase family 39 protein [Candidatus Saccharimonadales bacterium]
MGRLKVNDFYIYRWRYPIGFTLMGALLILVLFVVGFLVPNGLSKLEMASVVTSVHTPPNVIQGVSPENVQHLPYHILQKLSIMAFGFNQLAIKLPALVMAFCSILMLYGVVRLWFKRNTAIITSLIAVTSGQFLLLAQLGTPSISYIFWSAALLFFTSMLARAKKFRPIWLIGAMIIGGLSLYSPLMVYVLLALGLTSILHPHARFVIFRESPIVLALGLCIFLLMAAPLALSLIASPHLGLQLLGIPSDLSALSWSHILALLGDYIGFIQPTSGEVIRPAYSLAVLLIALIGIIRLFTAKYTAKSYILSIWFLCLIPILALQNSITSFTFIPVVLLVAFGIDYLIQGWYSLFPHNPYARVVGILPLSVLVFGITFSGLERFVYGYHYSSEASQSFSRDLSKVDQAIRDTGDRRITLIVPASEKKFFTTYATSLKNSAKPVITDKPPQTVKPDEIVIASREFIAANTPPSEILVSSAGESANRFYLYKNGYN